MCDGSRSQIATHVPIGHRRGHAAIERRNHTHVERDDLAGLVDAFAIAEQTREADLRAPASCSMKIVPRDARRIALASATRSAPASCRSALLPNSWRSTSSAASPQGRRTSELGQVPRSRVNRLRDEFMTGAALATDGDAMTHPSGRAAPSHRRRASRSTPGTSHTRCEGRRHQPESPAIDRGGAPRSTRRQPAQRATATGRRCPPAGPPQPARRWRDRRCPQSGDRHGGRGAAGWS